MLKLSGLGEAVDLSKSPRRTIVLAGPDAFWVICHFRPVRLAISSLRMSAATFSAGERSPWRTTMTDRLRSRSCDRAENPFRESTRMGRNHRNMISNPLNALFVTILGKNGGKWPEISRGFPVMTAMNCLNLFIQIGPLGKFLSPLEPRTSKTKKGSLLTH